MVKLRKKEKKQTSTVYGFLGDCILVLKYGHVSKNHGIRDVSSKISIRLCHKEANQLTPGDGSKVFVYVRKYNRNQPWNNGSN